MISLGRLIAHELLNVLELVLNIPGISSANSVKLSTLKFSFWNVSLLLSGKVLLL